MLKNIICKVIEKNSLTQDVLFFKFIVLEEKFFNFLPGQYLLLEVPSNNNTVSKLYSIASPPSADGSFELIIKLVSGGIASAYLENKAIGDVLKFKGPAGGFIFKQTSSDLIFLITGTGIAPARCIIKDILFNKGFNKNVGLYWGLHSKNDLFLTEELEQISAQFPNFSFKVCLSSVENIEGLKESVKKNIYQGHIDEIFKKDFLENKGSFTLKNTDYYLCGRSHIVEETRKMLGSLNIHTQYIHFERF